MIAAAIAVIPNPIVPTPHSKCTTLEEFSNLLAPAFAAFKIPVSLLGLCKLKIRSTSSSKLLYAS